MHSSLNSIQAGLHLFILLSLVEVTEAGGTGIALDAAGNAFISGYTTSLDYPTTPGAFLRSSIANTYYNVVTKLNATGTGLILFKPISAKPHQLLLKEQEYI